MYSYLLLVMFSLVSVFFFFFFSSRRRHTRCALVMEFRRVLFRSRRFRCPQSRDWHYLPRRIHRGGADQPSGSHGALSRGVSCKLLRQAVPDDVRGVHTCRLASPGFPVLRLFAGWKRAAERRGGTECVSQ